MKYEIKNKNTDGFVALISAIIIAFMLIIISVTVGMTSLFGRFNVLDSESKERSSALAEACADTAILEVSSGTYSTNETINVGPTSADTCTIVKSNKDQPTTNETLIKTQSIINKTYTNIMVTIDSDYNVLDWQECTNFTGSANSC